MDNSQIDIDPGIPNNAVSIYGRGDAMDDFPVLKAFQQYIDAEHAKARKRLISLGIFFGVFTGIIIAIFVVLLMSVSARNQALNDRLIEFAMKDRDRGQAAVVVQPPIQQDNSALMAVTAKLEALQKELTEKYAAKTEEAKKTAEPEKPKGPTAEELEIQKLKALLSAEKEKLAEEKKRQKELELEAYRRKHYPELYGLTPERKKDAPAKKVRLERRKRQVDEIDDDDMDDIDELIEDIDLDGDDAISYFDEEEEEAPRQKTKKRRTTPSPSAEEETKPAAAAPKAYYSIPVEVRGTKSSWQVPND